MGIMKELMMIKNLEECDFCHKVRHSKNMNHIENRYEQDGETEVEIKCICKICADRMEEGYGK